MRDIARYRDRELKGRASRFPRFVRVYSLYLPDQQLLHIRPTFPPIFLAITRCAAMRRPLLPAVSLDSVMDVLSRVMSATASVDEIFCQPHARARANVHHFFPVVACPRQQISANKRRAGRVDANDSTRRLLVVPATPTFDLDKSEESSERLIHGQNTEISRARSIGRNRRRNALADRSEPRDGLIGLLN